MLTFFKTYWKIIIGVLLALAALLGLSQRKLSPELGYNRTIIRNETSEKSLEQYYQQSQDLSTAQKKTTVTFLAAGDIMLSRNVAAEIKKSGDVDLPFRHLADILNPPAGGPDFNFANLESPIVSADRAVIGGHSLIFGAPDTYVQALKNYNFKILNLANNHAFDQGLAGLDFTRSLLDADSIRHMGTGDTLDEAWQPAVINASGIKICFIGASFSSLNDGGKAKNNYVARIEDLDRLQSAIRNAQSACDFIVATMHAGTEYTRTPNQAQIKFAHAAIDDGADLVIGAHPHWVQTVEKYCPGGGAPTDGQPDNRPYDPAKCKYIFYSLGNFIFDQEWSQDTKEGLMLKIQVSKNQEPNPAAAGAASLDDLQGQRIPAKLDSVELIPIILENYSTPRPATPEETKNILEKIGQTQTILK